MRRPLILFVVQVALLCGFILAPAVSRWLVPGPPEMTIELNAPSDYGQYRAFYLGDLMKVWVRDDVQLNVDCIFLRAGPRPYIGPNLTKQCIEQERKNQRPITRDDGNGLNSVMRVLFPFWQGGKA